MGLLTQIRLKLENPEKTRWAREDCGICDNRKFHFNSSSAETCSESVHIENQRDARVLLLVRLRVYLVIRAQTPPELQWDQASLIQALHQTASKTGEYSNLFTGNCFSLKCLFNFHPPNSPRKYRGSRTSASLKVKGLLGRVWTRDSKSKSCENLHVL